MAKNPLYIRVPRKVAPSVAAKWNHVRFCNGSRKKMVDFICGIGGYSNHGERYAIEFNVATYGANLDVEHLWNLSTSDKIDVGPDTDLSPEHLAQVKALFWRVYKEHKDSLWQWGCEEAYEGWSDSDTPYFTFADQERIDWKWALTGRGGKHLCMTECEGINLMCSEDDLRDTLMEVDDGAYMVRNDAILKLFIICVQNFVELTPKSAAEEVEYRATWRLWASFIEDQVPAMVQAYDNRQVLAGAAEQIRSMLMDTEQRELADSFNTICILADINFGE